MVKGPGLLLAGVALGLAGCAGSGDSGLGIGSEYYSLARVRATQVGNGSMVVTPPRPWNRARRQLFFSTDQTWVEDWTLNGPYLDGITFVTGLPNNRSFLRQYRTQDRQVPNFRSDMTAPEITAMIESLFRVRGGAIDFRTLGLTPRVFLGTNGFQFDYEHLDSDELWRRGRAVGAVINGRLYLILLDATRSHYFANALPDFEAMVGSARRR